jgi:hypothetical protein
MSQLDDHTRKVIISRYVLMPIPPACLPRRIRSRDQAGGTSGGMPGITSHTRHGAGPWCHFQAAHIRLPLRGA